MAQIGLTPNPGTPIQTIDPQGFADYVAPNVSMVAFNDSRILGNQCILNGAVAYLAGIDSDSYLPGTPPYIYLIISKISTPNGSIGTVCGFYDVTTIGPDEDSTITDCYNMIVPTDSAAYYADLAALSVGC